MKPDLSRFVPAGIDAVQEGKWVLKGLGCSAGFSFLLFIIRCSRARGDLFTTRLGKRVLIEGAVMSGFRDVLGIAFAGFAVLALAMLALAAYHYVYHRIGSRSIYLMRRLPDRSELHRRCLALPAAGIVCCVCAAFLLLCIYYWIYIAMTPAQCLVPGQWQALWR